MSFETALFQWENGERRLREAPAGERAALERATEQVVNELRRRLGSVFTADELADLYSRDGTEWCRPIAMDAAPDRPWAWDAQTVADAAFLRYLREATDFAGGRRLA